MIFFAGYFSNRLGRRVAQHLMRVELAEVDCLSRIAIGFWPGLRNFINHPGGEFMLSLSHQLRHSKQQLRALFCRNIAPSLESFVSRFDGAIREFLGSLLKLADDLSAIRRIDAVELVLGFYSLAADD